MATYQNKNMTPLDWTLIAAMVFFMSTCYFGCKTYSLSKKPDLHALPVAPEEFVALHAQKRYDSLSVATAKQMDSLHAVVAESKKKSERIIVKYKNIHDTILITLPVDQIRITKMLCPGTGDSVNLQEINYCLADGKQAQDLYKNSLDEINALEMENKLNEGLVMEGLKNMEAKDTLIDVYKQANDTLGGMVEKEKHQKKAWRNYSFGATVVAVLFSLLIAL